VAPADRFCEDCGGSLSTLRKVAIPRPPSTDAPCTDCGNDAHFDEYCNVCGHRRAQPDRDEASLGAMALITDRGIEHARNEDAAAAGMLVGSDAAAPDAIAVVVCDGVSSSDEAHKAAVAASTAGVDAMLTAIASSKKPRAAMLAGLDTAAKAAVAAGVDSEAAPSCTYTAAIVIPTARAAHITVGNVGDSRAYWLPEPPGAAQQLTVDDSLSQELITAGASPDSEAVRRGAHTLTRWLGADSDPHPRRFAPLFSLSPHWQSDAAAPAQGDVRPSPRTGTFHQELSPRHVCTTRANSRGESRRRRDDPGRPSHAASLSRTVDANRYHGRHEGSRRKGQPSRSASRANSAQCPPADSRCWTHGSLCGSRRGRENDRGSRETSDDVPPHWASLRPLHGVRCIGGQVVQRSLRSAPDPREISSKH